MRPLGLIIVFAAILAPLYWFIPLAAKHDALAVYSQYIGVVALIAMGISQLIATRFTLLEKIFGGLDRIYVLHKWLGIGALAAVLLHDTIDADIDGLGRETGLTELAETFGEFSLYSFLILGVITVATFIPYHWWRLTHKFMGALFALSAFHYLFIIKPFDIFDPVGVYTNTFCAIGIICYLYTLLPFSFWQGRYSYRIEELNKSGGAVAVGLVPSSKGLRHQAGQFAFVKFKTEGDHEVHPFTISSAPQENRNIRFTFKPLGDDTYNLAKILKTGVRAKISPAFGHFTRRAKSKRPEIWIAGGIGITPFMAFAQGLDASETPIQLFYCVKSKSEAAHLSDLEALAAKHANFKLHLVESSTDGRLTPDKVAQLADQPVSQSTVFFCGPEVMRALLMTGFRKMGLGRRHFRYEEFEIRQGIVSSQTAHRAFVWFVGVVGTLLAKSNKAK